ncbi:MAG: hypothetical protein WA793_11450, partial [Sphingorhabdus sp.]|uniref:hypothetical protein n=1 Tax=Sphingorhabdus sp. TaxID=1902408 RepID=UPI003C88463B
PLVAGHGVSPMALLFMIPGIPAWQIALQPAALIMVAAGVLCLRKGSIAPLLLQMVSAVLLYGSWASNILYINQFNEQASRATAFESMLLLSLPFQIASIVVVYMLGKELKRACSQAQP